MPKTVQYNSSDIIFVFTQSFLLLALNSAFYSVITIIYNILLQKIITNVNEVIKLKLQTKIKDQKDTRMEFYKTMAPPHSSMLVTHALILYYALC